jgi:hypothetical protein
MCVKTNTTKCVSMYVNVRTIQCADHSIWDTIDSTFGSIAKCVKHSSLLLKLIFI